MTTTLATPRNGTPQRGLFAEAVGAVLSWQRRHRARASLARLDAHMLRDIGLSLGDAQAEISKPFWRD
jgi:uncharacterized protein YjiS (DUF1127 family)